MTASTIVIRPLGRVSQLLGRRGHHAEGLDLHTLSLEVGLHFRPYLLVKVGIRPAHAKVFAVEGDRQNVGAFVVGRAQEVAMSEAGLCADRRVKLRLEHLLEIRIHVGLGVRVHVNLDRAWTLESALLGKANQAPQQQQG